ncbi:MAG TPA: c-type cytochrome, partial [Myxococcota bacterium]
RPRYARAFASAGVALDDDGIARVLSAYVAHLTPRNAPADRYAEGDENAISADARHGAALFMRIGCASCHTGLAIGGDGIARFGVAVADPYAERGQCSDDSFCRSDADCAISGGGICRKSTTVRSVDQAPGYLFRVPSLRCVAETAPYFHDGSARTLEEAVSVMGRYQLGRTLSDDQIHDLVAYLRTLTGSLPPGEI